MLRYAPVPSRVGIAPEPSPHRGLRPSDADVLLGEPTRARTSAVLTACAADVQRHPRRAALVMLASLLACWLVAETAWPVRPQDPEVW